MGDSSRGVIGDLTKFVMKGLSAHIATYYGKRNRKALTDNTSNEIGDILLYQTRWEEIRTFIREIIQSVKGPVIVLAHSLGGIIECRFVG